MRFALFVAVAVAGAIAVASAGCAASPTAGAARDGGSGIEPTVDAAPGDDVRDLATGDAASATPPDLAGGAGPDLAGSAPDDLSVGSDCVDVGAATPVRLATATVDDDFALTLSAQSASATSWAKAGNEALVLDVLRGTTVVGQLVLHQGHVRFGYGMALGALNTGDAIAVRVSARSAAGATPSATVCGATLTSATQLGAAGEGLRHAPVFIWPAKKVFDDLPLVLGWSAQTQEYVIVYSNENGGTVVQCGGGATGMRAELARWGRGCDIETVWSYGAAPTWLRCTGIVAPSSNAPRMEGVHPRLYYGDGHNRLFESRSGYGAACGTGAPEKADGDLIGWNTQNPSSDPSSDAAYSITVRPLPVDLDVLGFPASAGRREALVDHYAPWLYRLTDSELTREGKVDGTRMLPMERYLFVDVQAADVDGNGDRVCALSVSKGFVLKVHTAGGATIEGPQMTQDYMGGSPAWKRLAVPLDRAYEPSELTSLTFDAYDKDGIYFLAVGDAFMPRPDGDNGATLDYLRRGERSIGVYVDDDSSGCTGGVNHDGPGGGAYPCVADAYTFAP